jgi:hypothetical protein
MKTRILIALFWWFALLFTLAVWVSIFALLGAAYGLAHDAPASRKQPYGWKYDISCCNTLDCRQLEKGEVEETDTGFIWRSKHSGATHHYARGTTQIRRSQDEFYHGCESQVYTAGQTPRPLCLYIPDKGI